MSDVGTAPREIVPVDHSVDPDGYDRWQALSDRCNPILVREILQALSSRGFFGMLALSTVAVCVLGFAFAWAGQDMRGKGRSAFSTVVACIVPIAIFMVPVASFQSMRQEVQGGLAEQISLTRLRPRAIVFGKTLAGVVQFVVFLAMFAPVMALTFLLRGVDVPTIAVTIVAAFLASITANSFAVAMATVGRNRVLQSLMQALTSITLIVATFGAWGGAMELPQIVAELGSDPDVWLAVATTLGLMILGLVLFAMIATVSLAHTYENRSTPFRMYALFTGLLMPVWMGLAVEPRHVDEAVPYTGAFGALILLPIWLYACCEHTEFSPRVRATVSPRPGRARLLAFFLPGGDRGLAFTASMACAVVAISLSMVWVRSTSGFDDDGVGALVGAWCYAVFYGCAARVLRARLVANPRGNVIAFALVLFGIAMACILPLVFELLFSGRIDLDWHAGHTLNPFFTLAEADRHGNLYAVPVLLGMLVSPIVFLSAVRGWRTTMDASAARRERDRAFAAAADAPAEALVAAGGAEGDDAR